MVFTQINLCGKVSTQINLCGKVSTQKTHADLTSLSTTYKKQQRKNKVPHHVPVQCCPSFLLFWSWGQHSSFRQHLQHYHLLIVLRAQAHFQLVRSMDCEHHGLMSSPPPPQGLACRAAPQPLVPGKYLLQRKLVQNISGKSPESFFVMSLSKTKRNPSNIFFKQQPFYCSRDSEYAFCHLETSSNSGQAVCEDLHAAEG